MKRIIYLVSAVLLLSAFTFAFVDLKPVDNDGAVSFVIKNFGINTNGNVKGLRGTIKWDAANPSASQIDATVDVTTLNTGIEMRDKDLMEEKYFDAAKYPTIKFTSTAVSATSITGNLTLKSVTKSITFPITVTPNGNGYQFEGKFNINRRDYGIGGGSMVLSDEVKVTLKVQANP
jgi:polyisoprenoid-binding protein YceI